MPRVQDVSVPTCPGPFPSPAPVVVAHASRPKWSLLGTRRGRDRQRRCERGQPTTRTLATEERLMIAEMGNEDDQKHMELAMIRLYEQKIESLKAYHQRLEAEA